jgi:hypothetical protein
MTAASKKQVLRLLRNHQDDILRLLRNHQDDRWVVASPDLLQ